MVKENGRWSLIVTTVAGNWRQSLTQPASRHVNIAITMLA
ncbi:hypothetical protein BN128_3433 [Cronobacter sakazakii 696]|nr:hypothetical protein BN128_3433 [Cronobacter sakazakii 696]